MRARLPDAAEDWPWSIARAHLAGQNDGMVQVQPLLDLAPDWRALLDSGLTEAKHLGIRSGERTGRPLGSTAFVVDLETQLGRTLARQKAGRKPKTGEK